MVDRAPGLPADFEEEAERYRQPIPQGDALPGVPGFSGLPGLDEGPTPQDQAYSAINDAVAAGRRQQADVGRRFDASQQRIDELGTGRRAAMDPLYSAAMERLNRPTPQPPAAPTERPQAPNANLSEGMGEWVQAMSVLGLMAGALGRRSATTAMTAFGAGIQGMVQGKTQQFDRAFKIWQQETQNVIRNHEMMLRQYEAVLRAEGLDNEQKRAQLMLIAQQWQSDIDLEVLRSRGLADFAKNLQNHEYHLERIRTSSDRIVSIHDAAMARMEAQAARATGGGGSGGGAYSARWFDWLMNLPLGERQYVMQVMRQRRPDLADTIERLTQGQQPPGQQTPPASPLGPPGPRFPGDPVSPFGFSGQR